MDASPPTAWEPLTPLGVAAFAQAPLRRLLLVQFLVAALTDACVRSIGAAPDSVDILLFDIAKQDWATGGVLWSDKGAAPPKP